MRNSPTKGFALAAAVFLVSIALSALTNAGSLRGDSTGGDGAASSLPGQVQWGYYETTEVAALCAGSDPSEGCDQGGNGDSILRLIDPNGSANPALGGSDQPVCAMIYVFDDDEEMGECCSCPLTPAQLETFSVEKSLTANWGLGEAPERHGKGAIAVVAGAPNLAITGSTPGNTNGQGCTVTQSAACNFGCDPTNVPGYTVTGANNLLGSITHDEVVQAGPMGGPGAIFGITEIALADDGAGDPTNVAYLQRQCGELVGNGSGSGICDCSAILVAPGVNVGPTPVPPVATATATATATPTATATTIGGATATSTATATATSTPLAPLVTAVNLCPSPGATPATMGTVGPGSAGNYTVLAGQSITNTGPTKVTGNLGLEPGSSVGLGILVSGSIDIDNANAINGQNILTAAINDAKSRTATTIGAELGGTTLVGGVYTTGSSFSISSEPLTLDGQDNPNTVWIFQVPSSLTTVTGNVVLTNMANGCNVFWQVTSSASLGTNTTFYGNIMSTASITLTTGAKIPEGRTLAQVGGSITFDTNMIGGCTCP